MRLKELAAPAGHGNVRLRAGAQGDELRPRLDAERAALPCEEKETEVPDRSVEGMVRLLGELPRAGAPKAAQVVPQEEALGLLHLLVRCPALAPELPGLLPREEPEA